MKSSEKLSMKTFLKLLKMIGYYKIWLGVSMLLAAIAVVFQLYIPILFGDAIDEIISAGNVHFSNIYMYLIRIGMLIAIVAVSTWLMSVINNKITYRVVQDLRDKAISHIQTLPVSYLDSHSTGDIVGRVIADADQLADGLLLGFTQLFQGVVMIIVTIIYMLSVNLTISLMVIALTPVSFLVAKAISGKTFRMFRKQTETRGRQTAYVEEMIGAEKVVQAFGYEKRASESFDGINNELQKYSVKAIFLSSLTNPGTRAVNNVIYALVTLVGAFKIMAGVLSVGGLAALLSYANQYMKPFNDISSVITELQNALACAARVFELIETEPEKDEVEGLSSKPVVDGDVRIDNIYFSYDKNKKLIEHFSLNAKKGMKIAIVGPTGCGKTTLINLLMRFYDVDSGGIYVDGTSIYDVTRHSLRENYGMVLQDTWLKNATIRENIAYGRPDATEEEIIQAAKDSHSWSFIRRMSDGLDTVITDDSLSQGQKQLLCITRVMLCHPPILILDEATSNIDTRTEIKIQDAFGRLMKGRTSFIVAHRLSTIRNADVIIVMKDGKIIEQGDHETLMRKQGFYSELYNAQVS